MERTGTLIREKYRENLISTLAMSGSVSIANIVDRIMVGNLLGSTELAGQSLTNPILNIINIIFGFFIFGGNTLAVTLKGGRDQEGANKCYTISILGGMAAMALFVLAGIFFQGPIAHALCAGNEELIKPACDYLFPLYFTGFMVILVNGMSAYIRVDGLKTLAILIPIVANIVNLLMDYVFMGMMHLGIASAGWATNIGYAVGAVMVIPYLRSEKRSVFFTKIGIRDLALTWNVLQTGFASALVHVSFLLRTFVTNIIVISVSGVIGSQVTAVILSAYSLALIFYGGSTQTMLPIGGALYGEKDYKGLRQLVKTGLIMTEVFCLLVMAVFILLPKEFGIIFGVKSAEAGAMLNTVFPLFALSTPLTGLQEILRVCLQSTGRKTAASVMMASVGTICFIPVIWLLSLTGPTLLWLAFSIAPLLAIIGTWAVLSIRAKRAETPDEILLPAVDEDAVMYDFSIESCIGQAEEASERVIALCRENGVEEKLGNDLGVAAEELCTNIARYAYGKRSDSVDMFLRISSRDVVMRIRDNGVIFNPITFRDDSGREVTGLSVLRSLPLKTEYNRVLGFNNTIITVERPEQGKGGTGT
jgi:Na+-driven multidrug efflux pump